MQAGVHHQTKNLLIRSTLVNLVVKRFFKKIDLTNADGTTGSLVQVLLESSRKEWFCSSVGRARLFHQFLLSDFNNKIQRMPVELQDYKVAGSIPVRIGNDSVVQW
jgi:hypothetical protein